MAMKPIACATIPLLLAALPTQAVTLEQLNKQVQQMNQRIAEQDNKFRINGFASFGMAISDEEMAYNGVNDEITFNRFSKMGVQMTFNLDDRNSVVTQLVSRGNESWNTTAEWAYFKHDFGGGLSGKIGRIRLPAYQLSEFLDVGYATPYAQVPAETYDSLDPFANMEGIDLSYSMDVGDNTATFQFVYGRAKDDEFDLKDILGLNAIYQAEVWSARVGIAQASVDVVEPDGAAAITDVYGGKATGIDGTFASLGFTYDPGTLYFTTEFTRLEAKGEVVDADALYATVGYRMGRMMPFFTYATAESQDDDERSAQAAADNLTGGNPSLLPASAQQAIAGVQAASDRNTQRIGLGLRYDIASGTALKVQFDMIEVKDDKSGLFDDTAWATNVLTSAENPDKANILTISIDTVF
ncbi:MAG: porin [Gammaproteobacteria bacterium]|nr:porin [Gammaproteobacteria bacterium]